MANLGIRAWATVAILLFLGTVSAGDTGTVTRLFVNSNVKVGMVDNSAHVRIFASPTSDQYFAVRLGKIIEVDASGNELTQHSITSFSDISITAGGMQGTSGWAWVGASLASYIKLSLPLSAVSFSACPGAAASRKMLTSSGVDGFVNMTVFYNITSDTTVQYGGNSVPVAANATKINIEANGWPFCSPSNKLRVRMVLSSSRRDEPRGTFQSSDSSTVRTDSNGQITISASASANADSSASSGSNSGSATVTGTATAVLGRRLQQTADASGFATASFLVTDNIQANVHTATYATASASGTTKLDVVTSLGQENSETVMRYDFPAFTTLYFDPIYEMSAATSVTRQADQNSAGGVRVAGSLLMALLLAFCFMA